MNLDKIAYRVVKKSKTAVLMRRNDGKKWIVLDGNVMRTFDTKKQAMEKF
jgi:hypothetical protein